MNWRALHLLIGAAGLIVFVLQGQYMVNVLLVEEMPDGQRMMYRTAHIYLMLACAVNIAWSYGLQTEKKSSGLQVLISLLFLLPVPMVLFSFFAESTDLSLDRVVGSFALYSVFGGSVLALVAPAYRRMRG